MSLTPKIVAGAWSAAGGVAGVVAYRRARDFEAHTPCVADALRELGASGAARSILGAGQLNVAWWPPRHSKVDPTSGHATARFTVRAESGQAAEVLISSRRNAGADGAELEDELDTEVGGWRSFLKRPWELKMQLTDSWRRMRGDGGNDEAIAEARYWDLHALVLVPGGTSLGGREPIMILGDARSVPDYESRCLRRDGEAKDEHSHKRVRRLMYLALSGAILAGCFRFYRSVGVSRSYGYAKQTVLAHAGVQKVLGPRATLQSSSGTFGPTYINAKLRLVNDAGDVADVELTALRDGGGAATPWRVALARMSARGRVRELDKALF